MIFLCFIFVRGRDFDKAGFVEDTMFECLYLNTESFSYVSVNVIFAAIICVFVSHEGFKFCVGISVFVSLNVGFELHIGI